MAHHEIKIWPEFFDRKKEGVKPWEHRTNDRDFRVGDTVILREWCPFIANYTGSTYGPVAITYVFHLPDSDVIFSHTDGNVKCVADCKECGCTGYVITPGRHGNRLCQSCGGTGFIPATAAGEGEGK
jgi:hypothetical protein